MKLAWICMLGWLLGGLAPMSTAPPPATFAEIRVRNIRDLKGNLLIGFFKSEKDFLKKPAIGRAVKITAKEMIVTLDKEVQGAWAVSIIHDANENGELDTNFLGIPREGYGFGNDAKGRMGPPAYSASILQFTEGKSHTINLTYF